MTEPVKYLTNKEFLAEIHKSKISYCSYLKPEYAYYDAIVNSLDEITPELIEATRIRKAYLISQGEKSKLREAGAKQTEIKAAEVCPSTIDIGTLVFRVMTAEHIPLDPDRKRRGRKPDEEDHAKTNFKPFKHYLVGENGTFIEVCRSHWTGTIDEGSFCTDHGQITKRLAIMFMLLVDRYSRRSNWRGYTYLDEMKSHALLQLSQVGLLFEESKSDNPFAFYTTTIKNCLAGNTEILTKEYGAVPIERVAGQDVHLLDGNGDWVECRIFDHGVQETQETIFTQGRHTVTVRSTLNHGWFHEGKRKYETSDFGKQNFKIDDLRPNKTVSDNESYRKGVIHGIFYGDGSKSPNQGNHYFMRLCSNKHSLASYLDGIRTTKAPKQNGDLTYRIDNAWCDLKALPENPGANLDYLLGFLRGWLATDGCVAAQNSVVSLCGDEAEYQWLKTWAPLVGWQTGEAFALSKTTNYGVRNKSSMNIHFYKASIGADDLLNERHQNRWVESKAKLEWNTYKRTHDSTKRRMERVYCPIVRTTGSFALASGIHSANCFTRILNLEKKNQNIRDDLLIMHGVNPSYTRQNDEDHERAMAREAAYSSSSSETDMSPDADQ